MRLLAPNRHCAWPSLWPPHCVPLREPRQERRALAFPVRLRIREDYRVQLRKEWPASFLRMPRSGHGRQDNRTKRSCLAVPKMAYDAQRPNWSRSASLRKARLIAMDKGRSSQTIPLKTMLRTTRLSASSRERSGFSSMGTTLRICLSGGLPALADAIREFAE